jgi:opacity protein-like surface antigen
MRRLALLAAFGTVLLAAPASAQRLPEKPPSLVPWWAPREVAVVVFFQNGNITPELRLAWHIPIVQQRIDSLNIIVEGGGGYALAKRDQFNAEGDPILQMLNQWHIHAGISYEGDWAAGWHVGARITTGVTLYGARYELATGNILNEGTEVLATVEGRAEAGYRVGRVVIGLSFGVLQPWSKNPRLYGPNDIGGISGGIFFNWR